MSATGKGPGRGAALWGDEAGTTLVEALVVVALTAAIGAIAFPALSGAVGRAAMLQATAGLDADLRMARAQALRTGEAVRLQVREDGRGYGWSPGPQRGLIEGMTVAPAGGGLTFYADGSSTGGRLAIARGDVHDAYAVDPVTGGVSRATAP